MLGLLGQLGVLARWGRLALLELGPLGRLAPKGTLGCREYLGPPLPLVILGLLAPKGTLDLVVLLELLVAFRLDILLAPAHRPKTQVFIT